MKKTDETETTTAARTRSCPICAAPVEQPVTGRPRVACTEEHRRLHLKRLVEEADSAQWQRQRALLEQAIALGDAQAAARRKKAVGS